MKEFMKKVLKWCLIITIVGVACELSASVVFILLTVLIYKVVIKGGSLKGTLQGGVNLAQKGVDKLKE